MKKLRDLCAVVFIVCALPVVLVVGVRGMPPPQPPAPAVWVMKDCYTLEDVTKMLNSLPADRAVDAKVLAINSQRSWMGSLSTPYYVWYRK